MTESLFSPKLRRELNKKPQYLYVLYIESLKQKGVQPRKFDSVGQTNKTNKTNGIITNLMLIFLTKMALST